MTKAKSFDCVEMKWAIQRRIAEEFAGVSDEEANRIQAERVARNPVLGPFVREVHRAATGTARQARPTAGGR